MSNLYRTNSLKNLWISPCRCKLSNSEIAPSSLQIKHFCYLARLTEKKDLERMLKKKSLKWIRYKTRIFFLHGPNFLYIFRAKRAILAHLLNDDNYWMVHKTCEICRVKNKYTTTLQYTIQLHKEIKKNLDLIKLTQPISRFFFFAFLTIQFFTPN